MDVLTQESSDFPDSTVHHVEKIQGFFDSFFAHVPVEALGDSISSDR